MREQFSESSVHWNWNWIECNIYGDGDGDVGDVGGGFFFFSLCTLNMLGVITDERKKL